MLDSGQCSLLREKLTLARQVLRMAEESGPLNPVTTNEGLIQGAVALLGEARIVLLGLVAETCPDVTRSGKESLPELLAAAGEETPGELQVLEGLSRDPGSWWARLETFLTWQRTPGHRSGRPREEGLIAVADTGPDRSPEALQTLVREFQDYFEAFVERHDQW